MGSWLHASNLGNSFNNEVLAERDVAICIISSRLFRRWNSQQMTRPGYGSVSIWPESHETPRMAPARKRDAVIAGKMQIREFRSYRNPVVNDY
jgi:hypothetical protein